MESQAASGRHGGGPVVGLVLTAGLLLTSCGGSPEARPAPTPATGGRGAPLPTSTPTTATSASAPTPTGTPSKPPTPTRTTAATPTKAPPVSLAGKVIVIDPGHNADNGGHQEEISKLVNAGGFQKECNTVGTQTLGGYLEATFNWKVAGSLAKRLRDRGATVILTRHSNDGWGPCVDARGLTAANNDADLLVSIHGDGSDAGEHGFHVISAGSLSGYTTTTYQASRRLASDVRDAMVDGGFDPASYVGANGLDVRTDLGTLNRAGTPAVIVECGNMRNAADAATMTSSSGQARIATALADGIARFLS